MFFRRRNFPATVHTSALQHVSTVQWPGEQAFPPFIEKARQLSAPRILELGTRRAVPGLSTRKDALFPNAREYVGTDIEIGQDVDVVADVHRLSKFFGEESFDIIFTEAGFEHFKYPHLAAHEIMKALRVGGLVFVQTHQTFPIHAVPFDYFRFSTDALRSLFGTRMGMKIHAAGYGSPAAIYSRVTPAGHLAPAFLHVNLFAEKIHETPQQFIYEYDCLLDATQG
ncbi:MAG TPA: methyltransferase domain-containing protein [Rudaea sp.]|jgi:SAM-dependent methyltransferase|nr:methyltransferase domain-containing protein [Rudaea sp.]